MVTERRSMEKYTLKVIRAMHDLTQEEMAKRLGISLCYYNRIETKNRQLTPSVLVKICKEFGLELDQVKY